MGYLSGITEHMENSYDVSAFNQALTSKQIYELYLHGHRVIPGRILENLQYDIKVMPTENGEETIPKIQVKCFYPVDSKKSIRPMIKTDKKIEKLKLRAISSPKYRYFVKNKSLYPLMKERRVVFFSLLEGEIIKGLIHDFSQYDITVHMKGGLPITILRHSIYDLRDKKGRCYLKSFQKKHKDWKKSELYIS